jgi:DNA-directed RNA polymerase subunit RPC12/RpoP
MEKRIKLFATTPSSRIKLFSKDGSGTHWLQCSDCGYKFETDASTTNQVCPKCGGTRFNVVREFYSPSNVPEKVENSRRKLFGLSEEEEFQKDFCKTDDKLELKLKEFSGSSFSATDFEKEFGALGITAENLQERGFAEIHEDGQVEIREDSFLQSRLFSKLIISLTKTLELDPAVTMSAPSVGVQKLEEVSDLCPRSIAIIKKVHGIGEDTNSKESWLRDSGIEGDLKLEFGGQHKPESEVKSLIEDRYPDAPEGLLEMLKDRGIIRESGDKLEIIK